jgi:hypothetical protein
MFTADYMALQLTTPVMLAFAGYLFGDAIMKAKKSNG